MIGFGTYDRKVAWNGSCRNREEDILLCVVVPTEPQLSTRRVASLPTDFYASLRPGCMDMGLPSDGNSQPGDWTENTFEFFERGTLLYGDGGANGGGLVESMDDFLQFKKDQTNPFFYGSVGTVDPDQWAPWPECRFSPHSGE